MIEALSVYGFGSYFNSKIGANDIDMLLVHNSRESSSIKFAISSKGLILSELLNADIVLLSLAEEKELDFINKSHAVFLAKISSANIKQDISKLVCVIKHFI